jgi:hypothetical protein
MEPRLPIPTIRSRRKEKIRAEDEADEGAEADGTEGALRSRLPSWKLLLSPKLLLPPYLLLPSQQGPGS